MGTIAPAPAPTPGVSSTGRKITWETLNQTNDSGDGAPVGDASLSISVHVFGTWNGATCTIHGSNDGTNYDALEDAAGNALALTDDGMVSLKDLPMYIKPVLTSEGASTDLDAIAFVR